MKCPNCNVNLVMTDRNSVEIDYCPECRGIWLDRGELDKIIERSTQQPTHQQSNESYHKKNYKHDDDHYGYKKKKRGSFLGEMFDF